jgi:hypothetical protein
MKIVLGVVSASVVAGQDVFLSASSASPADLSRARTKAHSGRVAGKSVTEIAAKINGHLERNANMTACAEMDHSTLDETVRTMWKHFSPSLQAEYAKDGNDGRVRQHETLEEYEARWAFEKTLSTDESEAQLLLEAKCAEVAMLWAHHLPESGKKTLKDMPVPSLPEFQLEKGLKNKRYASSFTCVSGHNMKSNDASDHVWPHWPREVHYKGTGHGAYPFWGGPAGSGSTAPIEVWWSETKESEKFYHESCAMYEFGYTGGGYSMVPCYHLFVGGQPTPKAWMYTEKGDYCCESTGLQQKLSAPQSNFMDDMTEGQPMDFKGTYHDSSKDGKVRQWIMDLGAFQPVQYFWYLTTQDGHPVEQGEGGLPSSTDTPASGGQGITVWHEYDTATFQSTTHDASVFEIPAICKNTKNACHFP